MFSRRTQSEARQVIVRFDGVDLKVPCDISVAAALLAHTDTLRRSQRSASPRGPYCMMGVCFDCLVTIDGLPSQRACMVTVRDGMMIERQQTPPGQADD